MNKSKLIIVLNSFSPKEIKSFSIFLASPFFNTNEDLVDLFSYIKQFHPDFPVAKLSKKVAFEALYDDQPYDDKKLRYLMSDLLKVAEHFMLVQRIKSGGVEVSLQLLDEFTKRNLNKHFQQLRSKLDSDLAKNKLNNADHFLDSLKLADKEEKYFDQQRQRLIDDNAQQNSDNLNRYFVLKKLKYACNMLSRQAFLSKDYRLGLPDNWMNWLEDNDFWGEELIKVYTKVFLAYKYQENPNHFEELNTWLLTNYHEVSLKDLKDLLIYGFNYCAGKIREGQEQYDEKALNLYLVGIKEGALLENGYFSPWSFGNVVKLALRLEKYDWIESFMEAHQHQLPPEYQENTMSYNLAELHCYKKDFDNALKLLTQVQFSDLSYHLGSRIMLSKIYYELEEDNALLSLMSAFIMFLKRNKKISEPIRKTYLNFCSILHLIIRKKTDGIEEKIKRTPLLTDREWLLKKVADSKNS